MQIADTDTQHTTTMPRSRTRTSTALQTPPRSKAGCWTCRIRRKRCDEQQDDSGACQACVRLDIDCLGWGTRRPDWCRVSRIPPPQHFPASNQMQDKDRLAEYKLKLKKKLCTRAGTRPSSARHAQQQQPGSTEQDESEDEEDTGKCDHNRAVRLSDSLGPSTGFDNSPQFSVAALPQFAPSPQFTLPASPQFTIPVSPSLASLGSHLYALTHTVPAPYRSILHQILELHAYKSSIGASPDIVASRARDIEDTLERLARRAQFDSTFSSLTGFEFDPTAFLFNSPQSAMFSPASTTYSPLSDTPYGLVSPATMWSPELVSDTLSSAPTSPAVLGLTPIMPTNLLSNVNDWFAGYDLQPSSYMTPTPSTPAHQQSQSLDMLGLGLGLDGLGLGVENNGDEYLLFHNEHHPQISLFPSSPSQKSLPSPPPQSLQQQPSFESENVDPFGIHYKSCLLLLHAHVLCSPPHEIELLLQDLQSPSLSTGAQYAFAAILAGALSVSRRAFFHDVLASIEQSEPAMSIDVKAARLAMGRCESLSWV